MNDAHYPQPDHRHVDAVNLDAGDLHAMPPDLAARLRLGDPTLWVVRPEMGMFWVCAQLPHPTEVRLCYLHNLGSPDGTPCVIAGRLIYADRVKNLRFVALDPELVLAPPGDQ